MDDTDEQGVIETLLLFNIEQRLNITRKKRLDEFGTRYKGQQFLDIQKVEKFREDGHMLAHVAPSLEPVDFNPRLFYVVAHYTTENYGQVYVAVYGSS